MTLNLFHFVTTNYVYPFICIPFYTYTNCHLLKISSSSGRALQTFSANHVQSAINETFVFETNAIYIRFTLNNGNGDRRFKLSWNCKSYNVQNVQYIVYNKIYVHIPLKCYISIFFVPMYSDIHVNK